MSKEFQHILRIADTDLDGTQKVGFALLNIKGVGIRFADAVLKKAGVNKNARLGFLSETDLEKIKAILKTPSKYDLPSWLLNRSRDVATGKDLHQIGSDLVLQTKTDIDQMKSIKSWRGFRHAHGLRVRGQRTKTTGRKGKAVGVKKKRLLARGKV
ncbi:MAG: 30S ribosomal protein S13 [Candidatus Bathyarchaeota archaeon]|nr:30S ribosomal protein S13 [Candidatus Bathyarchaeota archaeon]MDH5733989.1 30S ribosomal protein S13 [Candidatus Bathyarchaeota archaeon]